MPPTSTDRRPIAQNVLADVTRRSSGNPRGWVFYTPAGSTLDQSAFRLAAIAQWQTIISVMTGMGSQGGVFWDLDGSQYPDAGSGLTSNVRYLGDPVRLGTTTPIPTLTPPYPESSGSGWAPEMDAVADELMAMMATAGLKVGMTIRPSTVVVGGLTGQLVHQAPTSEAAALAVLDAKITYCKNRWGAVLFYVDTATWNASGGYTNDSNDKAISGTGWDTLYAAHPDVLLMPEGIAADRYTSTCPYGEYDLGFYQTLDGRRPGFSLVNCVEGDLSLHRSNVVLGVRGGDILMFRGWFNDPQNIPILSIYQEGKLSGVTAASNVVVSTTASRSYGFTGRYPDAVADLTPTPISSSLVRVTFTPPPSGGAFDYVLERSTDLGVTWATLATIVRDTVTQYDDTGRTVGVPNRYRITPRNFWGTGPRTTTTDVFTNSGVVAPVADFFGSPLNGAVPFNVQLTDQSQNGPTSWSWSATNGWTSTLQNPVLPDTTSGFLSVTLTATNSAGSNTVTKVNYIAGTNPVPPPPPPPPPAGTLQFSASTYSVGESDGNAVVTVTRSGGSFGVLSASYATSDGTATAGLDYTAVSGALNWADGNAANKTFVVPILGDSLVEGSETVNLTLTSATLGTPSTAVLTIVDDDVAPPTSTDQPWEVWVSPGDSSARVEWWRSPTIGVIGYNVYQGSIDGFIPSTANLISTTDANTLLLDVPALTNGVAVFFKVCAVSPAGESSIVQARHVGRVLQTPFTPQAGIAGPGNGIVGHAFHYPMQEVSDGTTAVPRNSIIPYGPQPLCEEPVTSPPNPTLFVPSVAGPAGRLVADMRAHAFRMGPNVASGGRVLTAEVGDGDFADYHQVKFDSTVSPFQANGVVLTRGTGTGNSYSVQRISGTTATTLRLTYTQRDGTTLTADLLNSASTSEYRMVCVEFKRTAPPADAGVVTLRVVTAAGTILTASGNYTRGPRFEANAVRYGSRNGTSNVLQGWSMQAGMVRGTISDAQLIWLANSGLGRAASEIRLLPIPDPGTRCPVGYPRDHGVSFDGRDGPLAYTTTPTGPGDDGRRNRGSYYEREYPLYQWSPTLAATYGRYIVPVSSDHDNGVNGGMWLAGRDQIGAGPLKTNWVKVIPDSVSQAGRAVSGLETPDIIYRNDDPAGKPFYCTLHGPVSGSGVSGVNSGSLIKQESQLFRTATPFVPGSWEYVGPCVRLSVRDTYATSTNDHTHTGYVYMVPPFTLGPGQTKWVALSNLSDWFSGTYFNGGGYTETDEPLTAWAATPTQEFLDVYTAFHPYRAVSKNIWFQNVFALGGVVNGVGTGEVVAVGSTGWVNDNGVSLNGTGLFGVRFVDGGYRRPDGRVWMIRAGQDVFPSREYIQDSRAFLEDGIVHFKSKGGYPNNTPPTTLSPDGEPGCGYDVVYWLTSIADATVAASARPVGTKATALGGGSVTVSVRDALPHKNYRVYRKLGAGSYSLVATAPPTQSGTLITYTDAGVAPGNYTYQIRTVNGAVETAGADLAVTAT